MTSAPLALIYNPAAGRGRAARKLAPVCEVFDRLGIAYSAEASTAPGDVEARARRHANDGAARIVVMGGDGSIYEAVNGVMASGSGAALGVIPAGSGNDFAKANAIPAHATDAAELLADRLASDTPLRQIDLGCMNGRYFANGAGIGFDAKVSAIANSIQFPLGDAVYLLAVARGLISGVITPHLRMECDEHTFEGQFTLANFSNGQWVGSVFPIAPMAKNNDGLLDLVYVDALSRARVLRLLPKLLKGKHMSEPEAHHQAFTSCRVQANSPIPSHLDGEDQALQTQFDIEVVPGALTLL